jgi:hypothetical protein
VDFPVLGDVAERAGRCGTEARETAFGYKRWEVVEQSVVSCERVEAATGREEDGGFTLHLVGGALNSSERDNMT